MDCDGDYVYAVGASQPHATIAAAVAQIAADGNEAANATIQLDPGTHTADNVDLAGYSVIIAGPPGDADEPAATIAPSAGAGYIFSCGAGDLVLTMQNVELDVTNSGFRFFQYTSTGHTHEFAFTECKIAGAGPHVLDGGGDPSIHLFSSVEVASLDMYSCAVSLQITDAVPARSFTLFGLGVTAASQCSIRSCVINASCAADCAGGTAYLSLFRNCACTCAVRDTAITLATTSTGPTPVRIAICDCISNSTTIFEGCDIDASSDKKLVVLHRTGGDYTGQALLIVGGRVSLNSGTNVAYVAWNVAGHTDVTVTHARLKLRGTSSAVVYNHSTGHYASVVLA